MVARLPDLYYAVNRVLEDCTRPKFSKKAGVILWLIAESKAKDDAGPYLLQDDIVQRFGNWFVQTKGNARSEVSKAKKSLLKDGYILIAGGKDRMHLTSKGQRTVRKMRELATVAIRETLAILSSVEQEQFAGLIQKLLASRKLPNSESGTRDSKKREKRG